MKKIKQQNKQYEIEFFDTAAESGHYEISSDRLYTSLINLINENELKLSGKMLEAGCACGVFGKYFLKHYPKLSVIGVDISKKMVARANDKTKKYKAIVGDLEDKKIFKKHSFDVILCPFVLHHFPSLEKVFKNFTYWLKPKGIIIISEPNGQQIIGRISKFLRKIVEKTLGEEIIIKHRMATPNETNHTLGEYQRYLKMNDFDVIASQHGFFKPSNITRINIGIFKLFLAILLAKLMPNSLYSSAVITVIGQKK